MNYVVTLLARIWIIDHCNYQRWEDTLYRYLTIKHWLCLGGLTLLQN